MEKSSEINQSEQKINDAVFKKKLARSMGPMENVPEIYARRKIASSNGTHQIEQRKVGKIKRGPDIEKQTRPRRNVTKEK